MGQVIPGLFIDPKVVYLLLQDGYCHEGIETTKLLVSSCMHPENFPTFSKSMKSLNPRTQIKERLSEILLLADGNT